MEDKKLSNYDELLTEIESLKDRYSAKRFPAELLFRGQGNSLWSLETTLERSYNNNMLFSDSYMGFALKIKPEVESFTKTQWETKMNVSEIENHIFKDIKLLLPHLEYLIYLRHHGFPNPLLDWTRSEFIASFFAFHEIAPEADRVAMYVYIDKTNGVRSYDRGETPQITLYDEPIRSHPRHFVQKACYTISSKRERDKNSHEFIPHESVCSDEGEQELLFKFSIPASERKSVLRRLDAYNINPYTLFQTEDALISSLALREELSMDDQDLRGQS